MSADADPPRELLERAAQGDPVVLNDLFEDYRGPLRRMINLRMDRRMSGRVDASDVVQDVLLEASQRLRDYVNGPPLPFQIWLRQIAHDRMIDLYRRHRALRRDVTREQSLQNPAFADQSSLDLAARITDSELTPAAATIRNELQRRFYEALEQLGADDREIILMRHSEHLGNSEVAAALGLSPAAVGMRYLRALRRLRDVLGEAPSQS